MQTTAASQPPAPTTAPPDTRPSQRDLVVASLLSGHGTQIKRPGIK